MGEMTVAGHLTPMQSHDGENLPETRNQLERFAILRETH
jgi:hypothetical protein